MSEIALCWYIGIHVHTLPTDVGKDGHHPSSKLSTFTLRRISPYESGKMVLQKWPFGGSFCVKRSANVHVWTSYTGRQAAFPVLSVHTKLKDTDINTSHEEDRYLVC